MQQTVGSTVRKLNGKWQSIIRVKVNGKWKQVDTKYGFKTKAEAKNWISKNIGKYTKTYQVNGYEDITLRELKEIYLDYKKDKVKDSSHNLMETQLKQITSYEDRKIKTFTKMDMENLSKELRYKTKIGRYKQLFEFAIKTLELEFKNPARDVPSNFKKNKDTVVLSVSEFENELKPNFKKNEHLLILDIAFYTGLRSSEIAGLTYDDIFPTYLIVNKQFDKRTNSFAPPKSVNSTRKVPISNKLYKEIMEYRNKQKIITTDKRLFPKRFAMQPTYMKLIKVTKGTKFDGMNLHSLRHSYTTNLITNGIDFKTASSIIGDTVETVMKTYSHYTEQGYKQVEQFINSI